jgi:hypothetical protein
MPKHQHDAAQNRIRSLQLRAEQAGVSIKTLRREVAAGNLQVVRLGPGQRLIGITDDAWERYIRSRTS